MSKYIAYKQSLKNMIGRYVTSNRQFDRLKEVFKIPTTRAVVSSPELEDADQED